MDPKTVVVNLSSDDEDDDHNWLSQLLEDDDDVNNNDEEVIMVDNENDKNGVKNLKVKLKVKDCLLVDDIKDIDADDECVVLENDPNEKLEAKDDGGKSKKDGVNEDEDDEIVVVSEKGQVACRDFPHSRHLCIKFPFSTTPNQSHCKQCYCYVCDSLAPCVYWGNGSATTDHCHATDKDGIWRLARENARNISKGIQPVKRLPADPQRLAPAVVQPQNPITRPSLIPGPRASLNFRPPNFHNQNRRHILASRHRLHPDLVSQFLLKHHQNSNQGTRVQKPVFKKTASVGVTTSFGSIRSRYRNQISYASYGSPYGDTNRLLNQNYHVNGIHSRPNIHVGASQPNAVNISAPNPPRNQIYTSLTVNPPSPPEPQFSKQSNPSFQSQVDTSTLPGNPLYQVNLVTPSYAVPQLPSCQSAYMDPVPFSQVDSLLVSVSDYIQNSAQGTQAQNPLENPSFQDYELKLPSNQDSVTPEGAVPTSEPTLRELCDSLADYTYDWNFGEMPVEPGLLDIPGPNGLNNFSSDSTCIDMGPIFDF